MKTKQLPKKNQPYSACCNAVMYAKQTEQNGIDYIYCSYCEKKLDGNGMPIDSIKSIAYLRGYDAGLNGTNSINTHYSVFKDEQSRNDWEEGNAKGKEAKNEK